MFKSFDGHTVYQFIQSGQPTSSFFQCPTSSSSSTAAAAFSPSTSSSGNGRTFPPCFFWCNWRKCGDQRGGCQFGWKQSFRLFGYERPNLLSCRRRNSLQSTGRQCQLFQTNSTYDRSAQIEAGHRHDRQTHLHMRSSQEYNSKYAQHHQEKTKRRRRGKQFE